MLLRGVRWVTVTKVVARIVVVGIPDGAPWPSNFFNLPILEGLVGAHGRGELALCADFAATATRAQADDKPGKQDEGNKGSDGDANHPSDVFLYEIADRVLDAVDVVATAARLWVIPVGRGGLLRELDGKEGGLIGSRVDTA